MGDLTRLLQQAERKDQQNSGELFSSMYQELRRLARSRLKRAGPVAFLDTTSLVHESYLRFLEAGKLDSPDRSAFLAYAARVMRSVIIDFVRESKAEKRGGAVVHVTMNTDVGEAVSTSEDDVLRVHEVLDALAQTDARLVQVVEMKYFAGYTDHDIAESLGISERTMRREWQRARLIIHAALK